MIALAMCAWLAGGTRGAWAEYPERPIRLIVPFPAGGTVDLVARLVTARMADDLKTSFVIENRGGAGGVIATDATAKAAPDGYTLLLTAPNHTINAALQAKLPFDTEKDLVPVAVVAEVPELLVSHPAAPFADFKGFIAYAKANPGKLNYSSAGNGTLPHVTMELLLRGFGVEVAHIPYRGAAPAMTDLLAGQVQLKMDTYATANQHVAAASCARSPTRRGHVRRSCRRCRPSPRWDCPATRACCGWVSWRRPERRSRRSRSSPPRSNARSAHARPRRAPQARRHRSDGRRTAGIRRADREGDRAMARAREVGQHQAGLKHICRRS